MMIPNPIRSIKTIRKIIPSAPGGGSGDTSFDSFSSGGLCDIGRALYGKPRHAGNLRASEFLGGTGFQGFQPMFFSENTGWKPGPGINSRPQVTKCETGKYAKAKVDYPKNFGSNGL